MAASLANSVQKVPHSRIRELADIAFGMTGVLRLYFGESDLPTPRRITQAAIDALGEGHTRYTEGKGTLALRTALVGYYQRLQHVTLDPQTCIAVTSSGVQALNVAIRCVVDPGDEALVLTPAWPNGASIVAMSNAKAVEVSQPLCNGRYEIDWAALDAAVSSRTKLLLYTSPSNPLGWVATVSDQQRLLDFCRKHDLWLIADEVYDRLWYESPVPGTPVPSILRKVTPEDAVIVIHSFSKTYCMTGWRLGWLIARADLVAKATQLNEFITSCPTAFGQKAGEAALEGGEDEVVAMLHRLKAHRDFCVDVLSSIPGVTVPRPEGAFYVFPKIEGLRDSFDFCRRLLLETKVGIAPGVAFGTGGEGSVRICYAPDMKVLEPAMEKIRRFVY